MKAPRLMFMSMIIMVFSLSACVKQQNTSSNVTVADINAASTNTVTPTNQVINDQNYQDTMREQSARASADVAAAHGGGHGR